MTDSPKPLAGLRVADFSRVLAGPYATQRLADLGADVVKVERPGAGDETRSWGPPFESGVASYFRSVNRGKRSIALDISVSDGRAVAAMLCARSDVVIHNFLPESAARLGLDHASLEALRADVITCSISGFGPGREPSGRPGYDLVVQAESGLMAITGEPGGSPHKVGVAIVDVLTGLEAATAILAAVIDRGGSGRGAEIEVPLVDSAFAAMVNVAQGAIATGVEPARYGNAHPSIVPYESFEASDGHLVIAAANDGLWQRFCRAIDSPDLESDPRFSSNPERVRHRDELIPELARRLARRTVTEWIDRLDRAGVPCGRVLGVRAGFEAAADAGEPVTMAVEGGGEVVGPPARFSGVRLAATGAPPALGEHTDMVLGELGLEEAEIDRLKAGGVVA